MRLAVLGGGNGSFAAAADFARAQHHVAWWRRDVAAVAAHRAAGGTIALRDAAGEHCAAPALITDDIGAAMEGAELVLCPAPAFAQEEIAAAAAAHWRDGQVGFLAPGTLGSVVFARAQRAAGNGAATAFAETGTLPWLARKHGPHQVAVTVRATRLPVGVYPTTRAAQALALIAAVFPGVVEPCGDVLSAALLNGGPIIHPPLIMMNAGAIEHLAEFDIHKEGTQPAIRRVTDALDAERIAVRVALEYGPPHFPLADHYANSGDTWMYGRGSHDRLTDSGDWREALVLTEHRYMLEDTRLGLSLLVSAGELAGVPTPLARAFLAIGGAVCGAEFSDARSFATLGLGGMHRQDLQHCLAVGLA